MARVSEGAAAGSDLVHVVSLIEVFDIFAAYMRRGVADLIQRGDQSAKAGRDGPVVRSDDLGGAEDTSAEGLADEIGFLR